MSLSRQSVKEPFWAMSVNEAMAILETRVSGLAENEVKARLDLFGPNSIKERARLTKIRIILSQLASPLILLLLAAGLVTFFLEEVVEAAVILAAVLVNTVLGFWQENKAETVLGSLKSYVRTRARLRRSGGEKEADAVELVPGDIVRVSRGDRIPADARIIFANNLEVDESLLTGESLPVEKSEGILPAGTALADRRSMIFSGTLAVRGFADAVITATGDDTELGRIAKLVSEEKKEITPLQRAINNFTVRSTVILLVLIVLLFGAGLYQGYGVLQMFLIAVAVAVSAVPEGLPIALTVILAIGVQRLAVRKGIIRKLVAVEALGSTSLILTDKTGTLTQAKMELAAIVPYEKEGEDAEKEVLREALFNVDVVVENPNDPADEWRTFGKALEVALVRGAAKRGLLFPELGKNAEVLDRFPFSAEHKFSATVYHFDHRTRLIMVGAPEVVINYTVLPESGKTEILQKVENLALSGHNVLGVISKDFPEKKEGFFGDFEKLRGCEFRGIIAFLDPLREGVASVIKRISLAGVKTVIVTGDHKGTAEAVARNLGLVDGQGAVLTGDDLNYLKKEELSARADEVSVYARVTPEQKVMITRLYKEKGKVVALTGDGVNDAPALEAADVGIALGSGTDVAKGAADLVILDDNFETIVAAIEEGRKTLDNIRKVIVYLLSDSLDELFLIGGSLLAGLVVPINALQILFVNFFSDSFPAIAMAFEGGVDEPGLKPRKLDRNLFDRQMRFLILIIGVFTSALLFALYVFLLGLGLDEKLVRTFIFASFATYTLFLAFSIRSFEKNIFSYNPFSNIYLVFGVAVGLVLTFLVIYLPHLQNIFGTVALPPKWALGVLGVGVFNVAAAEFGKWILKKT